MKIGIIREGKVPPDFRVPLTPKQCKAIEILYPGVEILIQKSNIRVFKDEAYAEMGLKLVDDLQACDLIFGVKEIPVDMLIPNKTYIFFSHTIKKQVHNQQLLHSILEKKIRLIDYENIRDKSNKRLIGFGRYAGIVGCYNTFYTWGLKTGAFQLKPAHLCKDRQEVEEELKKVILRENFKVVLTGFGRVGNGAREIMSLLPIKEISPEEYLTETYNEPVFTHLDTEDYYKRKDGKEFVKQEFYTQPELYISNFEPYAFNSDMYMPCHFWSSKSPIILGRETLISPHNRIQVIGDISCDVNGPIASTLRASKIGDPIYGFDPFQNSETDFSQEGSIAVMAIDNLPCELPKDASEDFGNDLIKNFIPRLLGEDPDGIVEKATQTSFAGELMPNYKYLEDYARGLLT
ncbi:MAG: alanine dehydrogenase [Bacteroidetes bacterium]|nr:alanine dehydrogenase [Bacteroidota bacterium]